MLEYRRYTGNSVLPGRPIVVIFLEEDVNGLNILQVQCREGGRVVCSRASVEFKSGKLLEFLKGKEVWVRGDTENYFRLRMQCEMAYRISKHHGISFKEALARVQSENL